MPRKLLVGGLQRNGTLRSSTIKKVAPPVVPDTSAASTAATGRRHSTSSSASSSSACTTPVRQLHSPPPLCYVSDQQLPPPSPSAYDCSEQTTTFAPAEVFSEAQVSLPHLSLSFPFRLFLRFSCPWPDRPVHGRLLQLFCPNVAENSPTVLDKEGGEAKKACVVTKAKEEREKKEDGEKVGKGEKIRASAFQRLLLRGLRIWC